ncbi:3-oxoadipate enol-lactonase [Luteimonas sp. RD2P54]|uniref:3-oxoadipate enol-lactonase n=1 Tax=Luteimonas endophytica TaxID=3042023 RepID=A0ABT6J9Z3_9GAMM|nr:3-oxoadipate enol-lactonase [Luteimonas endophytica]MDH5823652.1 3-oxoadipate enol-lactonase [Luteimonas endophytica]
MSLAFLPLLAFGVAAASPSPDAALAELRPASASEGAAAPSHFVTGDGVRIAYRLDGAPDRPVLILANSIGTTLEMWDLQVPALSKHFRVLRYDMRGHGGSGVPPGAYSIDRLGHDVLELMDALAIERAHLLGLSLGGFVGQWLGVHAPERIDRLILSNTAAYLGPPRRWDEAIAALREAPDMAATAESFLANWFPPQMLAENGPRVRQFRGMLLATERQGLAGAWAAVRDADLRRSIALIERPTLVIAGAHDTVTLPEHGEFIAAAVPGATLEILDAVHLPNIERPDAYLRLVLDFLAPARLAGDPPER